MYIKKQHWQHSESSLCPLSGTISDPGVTTILTSSTTVLFYPKENHTVCGLSCLFSFIQHYVCEFHPYCCREQQFIYSYCYIIISLYGYNSIHSSLDGYLVVCNFQILLIVNCEHSNVDHFGSHLHAFLLGVSVDTAQEFSKVVVLVNTLLSSV